MQADRVVIGFLAVIAIALWGLLLRPGGIGAPVQAQEPVKATMPAIAPLSNASSSLWVVDAQSITLVRVNGTNGKLEIVDKIQRP